MKNLANTSRILSNPRCRVLEWVGLYLDASASKAVCLLHLEHLKPGKVKGKGKVVPVLAMKAHKGSRGIAPVILILAVVGGECYWHTVNALPPEKETAQGTHRIGSCVGLGIGPEVLEKISLLYVPGIEHNLVRCTICIVHKLNVKTVKSKTDLHYVYTSQGHAVTQLVERLRYKPEGHGFDSRWCHWTFSLTQSFQLHYGPGVDSASNRNEYQEYFLRGKGGRCVGLTNLPPSCADCIEIWNPLTFWKPQGLSRP